MLPQDPAHSPTSAPYHPLLNHEEASNSLSTQSKSAVLAFVVGGVAGGVILGLSAIAIFGPLGSTGFILSMTGGGVLLGASGGGLIAIVIANSKNEQKDEESSTETVEERGNDSTLSPPTSVTTNPKARVQKEKSPAEIAAKTYINEELKKICEADLPPLSAVSDVTGNDKLQEVECKGEKQLDKVAKAAPFIGDKSVQLDLTQIESLSLNDPRKAGPNHFWTEQGSVQSGPLTLRYASGLLPLRPQNSKAANRMVEDQVTLSRPVLSGSNTLFLVSNDGMMKHFASHFYGEHAHAVFETLIQHALNKLQKITPEAVDWALNKTNEIVGKAFDQLSSEDKQYISGTTANMVFLYPDGDKSMVGFFGQGDTRTIVVRKNGKAESIGYQEDGTRSGFAILSPGDYLFVASDGIWHNLTPNNIAENANFKPDEDSLAESVNHWMAVSLKGIQDDMNVTIISVAES